MSKKCKVTNGYAKVNDIVTILSYEDEDRYLYKITGFETYNGKPQILYRKLVPKTLEFFPETIGSWMDFSEAETELKIIRKGKNRWLNMF